MIYWVRSLRKIPTRLRGTNFCTSSARFAPSFVRQPNGPECTQIIWNALKHQFRVQWGGSGVFISKNYETTSWHELLHHFGLFCMEFCKATKQSQMHPNSTKHTKIWVYNPMGWIACIHCEIPARFCGTNFCTSLARFALSVVTQPNCPKRTQIVQNTPQYEFRIQWVGSSVFIAKYSDRISWHELLHQSGPFCTECCNAPKLSQMHPNSTKCTETWG